MAEIWKPMKEQNSKSYGSLATFLPLHLPYLFRTFSEVTEYDYILSAVFLLY